MISLHILTYKDTTNMAKRQSLRARILALRVGEFVVVPSSDYGYGTVRGYAYELGLCWGRRFSTHLDGESKTYTVFRTA